MDFNARLDADHLAVLEILPPDLLDLSDINVTREGWLRSARPCRPPSSPTAFSLQDHLTEPADGHQLMVRTYTPDSKRANTPALYWIHGGGMVLGDVALNDEWCADIANTLDIVVASVEYRLAPEFPYPVPMDDCYAGLTWFFAYAQGAGINTSRIAVGGGSAGGGLAAGLALLARDRGEVAPCFQLLTYPMIDDRNSTPSSHMISDTRLWNRDANLAAWDAYLSGNAGGEDVPIYAAPSRATNLTGLPPASHHRRRPRHVPRRRHRLRPATPASRRADRAPHLRRRVPRLEHVRGPLRPLSTLAPRRTRSATEGPEQLAAKRPR